MLFLPQPLSVRCWTLAFLLNFIGCVVPIREIDQFFATLAQDELPECGQPGKNPLKYSTTVGN